MRHIRIGAALAAVVFLVSYGLRQPPAEADWQTQMAVPSIAEFNGDLVTIRNVRNFRYAPTENDLHPAYYDKIYDLNGIARVWYVSEPFNEMKVAAHTFLSFEFMNGDFLAITIEARKTKDQEYSIWKGMLPTYPLAYIAADERDVVLLRANVRKDDVYVYPVKLSDSRNARILLADMLSRMNELPTRPEWYNALWRNCTSQIARHVNKISPGRISPWSWQLRLTSSADELALRRGLLDTDLPIEAARRAHLITSRSLEAGDVPEYSRLIRAR